MLERIRWTWGHRLGFCALATVLCLTALQPAQADLFILKDGYVLEGRVKREATSEFDNGEMIVIPKGFFFVDDGPRLHFFTPKLVRVVQPKARPDLVRAVNKKTVGVVFQARDLPPMEEVLQTGDFNDQWERVINFRHPRGTLKVVQRLGFINSFYARMDAITRFKWYAFYLTSELGRDTIRSLLHSHPDFKETPAMKLEEKAARRFKYCDFVVQAGWFDEADLELERMRKDFPSLNERIGATQGAVDRIHSREQYETIKRQHLAGQFETVKKRLASFPQKAASEQTKSDLAELKNDYDSAAEKMTRLKAYLDELPTLIKDDNRQAFADIAGALKAEVSPEHLPRLEAFMGQAAQAERQRKSGQTTLGGAELLSLAVTGWLLGNTLAESRPPRALELWAARNLVMDYLTETDPGRRATLLSNFQMRKDKVPLDEIVQMIPVLPPAKTAVTLDENPFEVSLAGKGKKGASYLLKLPPEYRHSRSYPVLIVLHREGEKANAMVDRWARAAADNGYILAAPQWSGGPFGGAYAFSEREHDLVLNTLRDLRRSYNVDSDRVFLFGLGQGATMAFDVGLSHPDQFAGVIPMAGNPLYYINLYWRNGQFVPFFIISGSCSGDNEKHIRGLMERWAIQRQYPMLWTQYTGRGVEWFSGEVPNIFDWMRNKRRAFPIQHLGNPGLGGGSDGNELCALRDSDNRFYWLSAKGLAPGCANYIADWKNWKEPAKLSGRIDGQTNEIFVTARGWQEVTVHVGPNSLGQNMINFDKPVTIWVNSQARWPNRKISPSLGVLLEELAETGDRQRLVLAKVHVDGGKAANAVSGSGKGLRH